MRRRGAQLPLPLRLCPPSRWQRQQHWQRQRLQLCSAATETPLAAASCQRILIHHRPGVHAPMLLLLASHACCGQGSCRGRGAGGGGEVVVRSSRGLAAGSQPGRQHSMRLPQFLLLLRCICRFDPIGYCCCCCWEAAVEGRSSGHSRREVGPARIEATAQAAAAAAAPICRCCLVSAVVAAQEAQGGGAVRHPRCRRLLLLRLPLIGRPCGCIAAAPTRRCKALREEPGRPFLQCIAVYLLSEPAQRSLPCLAV